jgi:eukaryotic-like serine/threonine-protein kinase
MTARPIACEPATSRSTRIFLHFSCRSRARGRRTRHPVDSLQTLVLPAPATGERPREGSLLHGRYRLLERLGAGGFGVVWRAQDELLHREVALKRIPLQPQASAADGCEELQAGERASREALAAARLAHPAIVALYEAYVDEDAFYLISELVHGDTLAALIAADALSDEELLQIGLALAQALVHAHARGVVHRDVKPHNVLVPDDRDVHEAPAKLTDFGGASLTGEDALTRTGETLGTLAYMAPEQSEGLQVGEPADLYSLALVLYEGLTGSNPVRGPTPTVTARRIGRQLPPLATRRPDLSRALVSAFDTALTVDPEQRGTLDELCDTLEQTLAQGLTRRRGLFGGARIARARSRPDLASWPDVEDWPVAADGALFTHVPASAEQRTAIDNHALAPRRGEPARRIEPAENRPARSDAFAPLDERSAHRRRFPLPRAVWMGCVLAAAIWLVITARPGGALLLLAAAAPVLLLGPRPGIGWLTAGLAPLLGLVGLAGAYPALAGQASSWSRRALLGALGYWWLTLAEPLLAGGSGGARLWLGPVAGTPARVVWEGSLDSAATHVIGPALSAGVLFGMLLWAAAAVLLPWLVRGSSAILDTIAAVVWSAALICGTPYFDAGLSTGMPLPYPRGAVIGGILAAAIAIAARALRGPVGLRHP